MERKSINYVQGFTNNMKCKELLRYTLIPLILNIKQLIGNNNTNLIHSNGLLVHIGSLNHV